MIKIRFTRKRIVVAVMVLVVVALAARTMRPQPLQVESALVTKGPLTVTVDEDGRTRAVDRYVITAPVTGRLARIALREGAHVRAGQVVARLAPLPFDVPGSAESDARVRSARARQQAAFAAWEQAEAARVQAVRTLERRQKVFDVGGLSREEIERFELDAMVKTKAVQSAAENIAAAEAEVSAATIARSARAGTVGMIPVVTPHAGSVLRIPEYSERVVNAGEPLLEIADEGALEVVIDVLSSDAVHVRPGMPATLTEWGGNPLGARVRAVEPAAFTRLSALGVEEQRVNVIVDFDDCPANLGEGYRVQASITVWSAPSVLVVPPSALFRINDEWRVFVIRRGRAEQRSVSIGERGSAGAQVLSGLADGERVILFPDDQIADGVRVRSSGTK